MRDVRKRFGATQALRGVSFEVGAGEVCALIGENGAGKSTLMKILSGASRPDEGAIELDGVPFAPRDPLHAARSGIAMIYQELNLAPDLTVEENILLGREPRRFGWLKKGERRRIARQALAEIHHQHLPLNRAVKTLTIAEQQIVEIARALTGDSKVLVMDEPTSSLGLSDIERLFEVIRRLRTRGVSIVYISHFLEECLAIADRYTVLRDGVAVGEGDIASAEIDPIIRLMVGREMKEIYPRIPHALGEPVLELAGVAGWDKPHSVDLRLHRGEILGLAGLVGAGRTETLRAVFGLDRLRAGKIHVFSRESSLATPARRWAEGVGLLSENRKEEGLLLNRSLADNLTLTRWGRIAPFGFIHGRRQRETAADWVGRLGIRAEHPWQTARELSGGNQQKLALGRLLYHDASILLLDEPTRGIDVASKADIYRLIGALAARQKAILFVSSYFPELLGICDRIAVMSRGRLVAVRPAEEWTEHELIRAAVGQTESVEA